MSDLFDFQRLLELLAQRLTQFLADELDIHGSYNAMPPLQKNQMYYLTSLVNVEGSIQMFVAFSYEEGLFKEFFERYTADLGLSEDELEEATVDSAGDVINIVVGNTLAEFNDAEQKITISPPIVITGAKKISCPRHANFQGVDLITEYGKLGIFLVNSPEEIVETGENDE